jgi:hypothetical protein
MDILDRLTIFIHCGLPDGGRRIVAANAWGVIEHIHRPDPDYDYPDANLRNVQYFGDMLRRGIRTGEID